MLLLTFLPTLLLILLQALTITVFTTSTNYYGTHYYSSNCILMYLFSCFFNGICIGWVNELLSWPGFVPLSRMTYCAYLVHPVIMTIITSSQKNKVYWSKITLVGVGCRPDIMHSILYERRV